MVESVKKHGAMSRIGRELGITGAAVAKLAARGMPLDSADAARRWRAANLNPRKMAADPGPSAATLIERAHSLVAVATEALQRHRFDLVADELRAALRAVPDSHRLRVVMPFALSRALLGPAALQLDALPKDPPGAASAEEIEFVGQVLYAVAAGEAAL